MKSHFVLLCIVILSAAALAPPARGDAESEKAAAAAMLISGPWKISTKTWTEVRVFAKDGTFKTLNRTDETGQWVATRDFVLLIYPNGHKDAIYLPLDPKGTEGLADDGETMNAVLQINGAAAPTPTPAIAAQTPAPAQTPSVTNRPKAMTVALLVARPWRFLGSWWYAVRIFAKDGTFTTVASEKETGTWEVTDTMIVLTFPDGHKDTVSLPLDPLGTQGLDREGKPVQVSAGKIPAQATVATQDATPIQSDMDKFFHPAPAPHVLSDQERNAVIAVLVAAPWKFTGGWWSAVRVFSKDGTFTTPETPKENGIWRIANDKVALTFADGHNDVLMLPLDPKGTDSAGKDGAPVWAVQQPAGAATAAAPAPTAAPFGTTPKPTPPPFGVRQPDEPR